MAVNCPQSGPSCARVGDAGRFLPLGVSEPLVNDKFGDVFGIYFAVTTEGFSDAALHDLARYVRREILTVDGVSDVVLGGLPEEAIYVEPDLAIVANQNIPATTIINAIATSNMIVDAGDRGPTRLQIAEGTDSVADISGLAIGVGDKVVNVADISTVTRTRLSDPSLIIRFNGIEAFTVGVAGIDTENIVAVGARVDEKLSALKAGLPVGVEFHPIYQQHRVVDEASNAFLINLAMSVAIVVLVLAVFMGWRAALTVGSTLFLTVLGTLVFMFGFAIEMERISLGALIIAMGMLVDNSIVVAEGMQTAMRQGKSSRDAAGEAASKTQVPLLGATVIGILAFAPIGLSPDSTGEFMFSLFAVVGMSLLLSWVLAVTVTPLMGHYLFLQGDGADQDAYSGVLFRAYGRVLRTALNVRWLVVVSLVGITAACFAAATQVKDQFFPFANNPMFFVNYKLTQGTEVHRVSQDLGVLEDWLAGHEKVVSYTSFAGDGAARFMLTYPMQDPDSSFGHVIVRVDAVDSIRDVMADMTDFASGALPEGEFSARQLPFGPGEGDPIQLRISGPDPKVLRALAEDASARMRSGTEGLVVVRSNWREQEIVVSPVYSSERAQVAGVTRTDIAETMRFATDGVLSGVYREKERQIPIMVRAPQDDDIGLSDHLVFAETTGRLVPMDQVIDGLNAEVQNTVYHRRDRVPTITVSATLVPEATAAAVLNDFRESVEAIELPPGYAFVWGGEYEDTVKAQTSLAAQLPFAVITMVTISVLLFNALRQPLIIWLLVPMSVNGAVLGLLATDLPFSFTALLGLLSLSGMLIKNGIVLVEEIDLVRKEEPNLQEAIVRASTSRLRPVLLAAATTILGMLPLLGDAFFVSMAVTIMAGLAFATILTMIAAPVLYLLFFSSDAGRANARKPALV